MSRFDVWMSKVDDLIFAKLGKYHVEFEDYNWSDEFDSDVPPEDAFEEWCAHTEDGTRSPCNF